MSQYYEKYLQNGQNLFETYCSAEDKRSIMLPRAPKQTYIDVYPETDEPGCSFQNDKQQQLNYEAEVKFYRALEKLHENLIILHGFEYTHFQYHLGDSNHDKRGCSKCKKPATRNSIEGECDFVVIAPNYFVIIEVKNMSHMGKEPLSESEKEKRLQALTGTFQKSMEQRRKMVQLIRRFCNRLNVLQFTVYPNFDRSFTNEFRINTADKSTIIFKEDLLDICNWWEANVSDYVMDEPLHPEFRQKQQDVRNMLLAIWCTDRNSFDIGKCSLGKTIISISDSLRSGQFTFRSNNPDVSPTPQFVKDYLGIDNLTKKQHELTNSTEKFLRISGPAGAGKTVVLLVKILELVLSSKDNKVALFHNTVSASGSSEHLSKPLEKAGIAYVALDNIWDCIDRDPSKFIPLIMHNFINNQVVIVGLRDPDCDSCPLNMQAVGIATTSWLISLVSQGVNVFADDIVSTPNRLSSFGEVSNSHVWTVFDLVQTELLLAKLEGAQRLNKIANCSFLSKNLRNTYDISKVLSVIRNRLIDVIGQEPSINIDVKSHLCPVQTIGHYMHGPKTVIHVLQNYNREKICDIVLKEVRQLLYEDNMTATLDKAEIGVLYSSDDVDTLSIVELVSQSQHIKPKYMLSVTSLEWSAVVVIFGVFNPFFSKNSSVDVKRPDEITNLYVTVSRARVKCTVIVYPLEGLLLDENSAIADLLNELENFAEIRRHPLTPHNYKPRSFPDEPSFWDYMREKFPGFFIEKEKLKTEIC